MDHDMHIVQAKVALLMDQSASAWMDIVYMCLTLLTIELSFNFVTNRNAQLPPIPADEIADNEMADGEHYEMELLFGKGWKMTTTV